MNMINRLRVIGYTLASVLVASGAANAAIKVGEPAPAFEVLSQTGEPVQLSDFKGKFVVLEWTNEGCPFVRKHYKHGNMQGLQKEFTDKDVTWLTVFSSKPGKQGHVDAAGAKKFQADFKTASTAMLLDGDGTVGRLYEAKTTPHMYVVNPDGNLIYAGGIDSTPSADPADIADSENYVKSALNEAMAGKPVSTPISKPYGCSIKY